MTIYNIYHEPSGLTTICKWDDDLNVLETYDVSHQGCSCPAGSRPTCRHRQMLQLFQDMKRVDTNWFYNFDYKAWIRPMADEELDALDQQLANPHPGVTVVSLDDPAALHETIAEAVGESSRPLSDSLTPMRRPK